MTMLSEQMLVIFTILALGVLLGGISWRGIKIGTAGVLFVALVAGHLGFSVSRTVMDLGLLLFVYAVGLQAGPRFFRTFRRQGLRFVSAAFVVALTGALLTLGLAIWLDLPDDLAAGLFTGALTCTPALAAAMDAFIRISPDLGAAVSVGYGIAYPFSMIGVVLLVQFLPRFMKSDLRAEERSWLAERQKELPMLEIKQYRVSNPNLDGRTIREINPARMAHANISRIRRNDKVFLARPDSVIRTGDVLLVVGPQTELEKIKLLLGEETQVQMDMNTNIATQDVDIVSPAIAGKTIADLRVWENYGVVITRIRRQGLEIAPIGGMTLEVADSLRVVGERLDVDAFGQFVTGDARHAQETSMLSYLVGLVLGIVLGLIPIQLASGVEIKLGIAGGAFLVSLLVGHFGRIGKLRLHVPAAAKNLSRELGLMLFLAGAGTTAGAHLGDVVQQQGWFLFLAGAGVTTLSVLAGLLLMVKVFRMEMLAALGSLTACMTNPPGLSAANNQTSTDLATLAYASTYPVALIFKIVLAQILVSVLIRI